jgi:eukaryotic-like serine/threonine-protein kinase
MSSTPAFTATPAVTSTATLQPLGKGGIVAFISNRADGKTFQIWTMNVTTDNSGKSVAGNVKQLTTDAGDKHQPAWSPDGKKLLFVSPGPGGGTDIYVLDYAGGAAKAVDLSNKKGDDSYPAWSPDGKLIVFTNTRDDGIQQLWLMAPDGSGQRLLSGDYMEHSATWSPKMDMLLYIVTGNYHDWLWYRSQTDDYKTPVRFDPVELFGQLGEVSDPSWSPDGALIAYVRTDKGIMKIYTTLAKSRGSTFTLLTKEASAIRERAPAWSPDSQWILFTSERDGNPEVYIMTASGLLQTNLTNSPSKDMEAAWQPLQ